MTRWLTIMVLLAAAAIGGFFIYQRFVVPNVTVTEVVEGPVVQAFYATGTLQPDREYPIKSNVDGIVTEMLVDKGSAIAAGQKIAFVRVDEYQMRFSQAQADLQLKQKLAEESTSPMLLEYDSRYKAASQQLELVQDELKRISEARASNATSQLDYDRAMDRLQTIWSLVESLKAQKSAKKLELDRDVTVAKAALDIALWNLDQQTIHSPIDGVVLDRPVACGTRVKINDHLLQVANIVPDKLVMRAAVDEEDKVRLQLDQKVLMTLYSYPGRAFEGRVTRVYPQADPDRRTFEVDVAIKPGDPSFSAGMTSELAFVVTSKDKAVVVPSQAVQSGNVWIVRNGRLEQPEVRIGIRSIERTEIISGLQVGDRVVISAIAHLSPGQAVNAKFIDPITAAGLNKPPASEGNFRGFN